MKKSSQNNRGIYIRFAEYDDSVDIFNWRNDEETRNSSFNSDLIDINDHDRWFKESLANPQRNIFIIIDTQCNKLGQIRFDRKKEIAEVSITINPKNRRQGIGSIGLSKAVNYYFDNFSVTLLIAKVKVNNNPSLKVFEKAGFKINQHFNDYVQLFYKK